ncbi:MAG: hypothetical protein ACLFVU_12815 [Phycisphaerae bacterium]
MKRILHRRSLKIALIALVCIAGAATSGVSSWADGPAMEEIEPGVLYRIRTQAELPPEALESRNIRMLIHVSAAPAEAETETGRDARVPSSEEMAAFVRRMRSAEGAVLLVTENSADRAGFLIAAYRVVNDGWAPDRAMAEYYRLGGTGEGERLREAFGALIGLARGRAAMLACADGK